MTTICLTFDFDAVSIWISTFKAVTPTPMSRGEYGARVGIWRILDVLDKHGVPATFFVPGHTAETYPEAVRAVAERGHEVAAHGYLHESPVGLSREEEHAILVRAERALENTVGRRPEGYRSPAWDLSRNTIALLAERGYLYDSSLMADDFRPFRARSGDEVRSDGRFVAGRESAVLEFPVSWELDDYPYFHFASRPLNHGLRRPDEVLEIWTAEFEFCRSQVSDGVFTLTMHPEIIGRGPRVAMLDDLIRTMRSRPGAEFATMGQACRTRNVAWR